MPLQLGLPFLHIIECVYFHRPLKGGNGVEGVYMSTPGRRCGYGTTGG